jgi:hypothetical protein
MEREMNQKINSFLYGNWARLQGMEQSRPRANRKAQEQRKWKGTNYANQSEETM